MNNTQETPSDPKQKPVLARGSRTVIDLGTAIGIGSGLGVVLGILMNNIAVGIAIGVALGAGVGAALEGENQKRGKPKD